MNAQQIKYTFILFILALTSNYTNLINHNSVSLGFSLYILFLFPRTYLALKKIFFRSVLLVILCLFPAIYFSLPAVSLAHVLVTSIGIFSCIELASVDYNYNFSRLKLYWLIQTILKFLYRF